MTDETTPPEGENDQSRRPSPAAALIAAMLGGGERAAHAPYLGSFSGDAISHLISLGASATEPKVVMIPTAGLEPGLPPQVPVLWDREAQIPIPVMDLVEAARPKHVRKGTAKLDTLDSFVDLVNRHKDEHTAIFAETSYPDPKFTAVIDYHEAGGEARWGKHRVVYAFPLTKEFRAWIKGDGVPMDQFKFAMFLEEHAAELSAPTDEERIEFERLFKERFATPAELLDLSRSLEVFVGAKVKNSGRIKSGERQLVFTTEHVNANGEPVDIPGIFMVSVPPFLEGAGAVAAVRIPARIRYRIEDGSVVWLYQLYRWEYVLRDRIQIDLADAAKRTGLPFYEGAPEMAAA